MKTFKGILLEQEELGSYKIYGFQDYINSLYLSLEHAIPNLNQAFAWNHNWRLQVWVLTFEDGLDEDAETILRMLL